jgi:Ca2+-transporting ATPase
VGQNTALSGIGKLVASTGKEQTPLQIKVTKFVKVMVIAGGIAFAFVWIYYWWESKSLLVGLLHGLAMAMSVLPEEIPVAFSAFMALGAYRLFKKGIIAKTPKTVETLGSATVICVDKTGTLTKNLMQLAMVFDATSDEEISFPAEGKATPVLEYAMWASEESPFDSMELSIHENYGRYFKEDLRPQFHMVKEFPLAGKPPVMTHLFHNQNKELIISCKGALEGVLKLCSLEEPEKQRILEKGAAYAKNGLRVLGVAKGNWEGETLPETQEETAFTFLGIITFYDPPAENIKKVISEFYDSNVEVKMITGDFAATALAIASQVGIKGEQVLTGEEINQLEGNALLEAVKNTTVFARVGPETKLKIIEALKEGGEVVSMTGDGVNDAPALKAAHIGIAMGKRGSDVAKAAAGLVLSGDDLSKMVDAIFLGRRIHINLSKAIRYIISIHVPIILLVIFPIFFGWLPSMLLTPIHVIFLELIMGPTCSIIYENEPVPKEEMKTPTKTGNANLLETSQLSISILQGVVIAIGCLGMGYYSFTNGADEQTVRSYMFSTLLISNIFLTLFNRSFTATAWQTMKWKNIWIPIILSISILILVVIHTIPAAQILFEVTPLSLSELLLPFIVAFISTSWMEVVIYLKQVNAKRTQVVRVNT